MNRTDLPFLYTTELSRLIDGKEVSPVEVTEAYLKRIDDLDFKFNAYYLVFRKEARQAAQEAEQAIVKGDYLGPMHGIPVAVKDQLWTKCTRSTNGSRLLADFIPDEDATVVTNLKKAGAIVLGKTNLALGGPYRFSTPRNPWNLDMQAGKSSGGSGAATAAFLCATSIGEDTAGSIRYPATWCGLAGIRPTWGRVSRYGMFRLIWSMDIAGPISRTVEDAAITLGAIAGYDPKDPYTWDTSVPDYRKALDGNIRGMRMGLVTEQINSEVVDPEVRETVVKATSVLGELGATVEEVSLPLTKHANLISSVPNYVEAAAIQRDWIRNRLQEYDGTNRRSLLTGSILPAQVYYKAQKLRTLVRQQVLEALKSYDVLVMPTAGRTATRVTADEPPITSKEEALRVPFLLTFMFNLTSSPAMSVPCGLSSQGLPIGLQIGRRPGDEETVLKVAHAYEQNTPWHSMRPPAA